MTRSYLTVFHTSKNAIRILDLRYYMVPPVEMPSALVQLFEGCILGLSILHTNSKCLERVTELGSGDAAN